MKFDFSGYGIEFGIKELEYSELLLCKCCFLEISTRDLLSFFHLKLDSSFLTDATSLQLTLILAPSKMSKEKNH